jgi:hypothetical protein
MRGVIAAAPHPVSLLVMTKNSSPVSLVISSGSASVPG